MELYGRYTTRRVHIAWESDFTKTEKGFMCEFREGKILVYYIIKQTDVVD